MDEIRNEYGELQSNLSLLEGQLGGISEISKKRMIPRLNTAKIIDLGTGFAGTFGVENKVIRRNREEMAKKFGYQKGLFETGSTEGGTLVFKPNFVTINDYDSKVLDIISDLGYDYDTKPKSASIMVFTPSDFDGNDNKGITFKKFYGRLSIRALDLHLSSQVNDFKTAKISVRRGVTITEDKQACLIWGRNQLANRFFDILHNMCITYEEVAMIHFVKEKLRTGLAFTDTLIKSMLLPEQETTNKQFTSDEKKWESLFYDSSKRGLFTNLVTYELYKGLGLVLDSTEGHRGSGLDKWYIDFLSGCELQGINSGQVLVALSYMYTGKYENKDLGMMGGIAGNKRYTIDKNILKAIVVKGEGGDSNTNFVRAYKSFISNSAWRTQLGAEIRKLGPYEFNKNLPYMFYYDKSVDTGEFVKLFEDMAKRQKNIKLKNSIVSLKKMYKTMSKVKNDFSAAIANSKVPNVLFYLENEHSVNTNTTYPRGTEIGGRTIREDILKNVKKSIGSGLAKTVEQKILSNKNTTDELIKTLGF